MLILVKIINATKHWFPTPNYITKENYEL
jgi:hypothetical protein